MAGFKLCTSCGHKLLSTTNYCNVCGTKQPALDENDPVKVVKRPLDSSAAKPTPMTHPQPPKTSAGSYSGNSPTPRASSYTEPDFGADYSERPMPSPNTTSSYTSSRQYAKPEPEEEEKTYNDGSYTGTTKKKKTIKIKRGRAARFADQIDKWSGGTGHVDLKFKDLFSDVFKKHSREAAEELFVCGTELTTPEVTNISAEWPHPWLFSRVLLYLAIAMVILISCLEFFGNTLVIPDIIFIGSLFMPFSVVVLFFEINAPRNISIYEVLKVFFIGGASSLIPTLILYSMFGVEDLTFFGALSVGLIEEIGKIVITAFILVNNRKYEYILNGILIGGIVGAGFAVFETAGYVFNSLIDFETMTISIGSMYTVLGLRGFLAPGGHVAWAAIEGAAIMIAMTGHKKRISFLTDKRFWILSGCSVMLHCFWDWDTFLFRVTRYFFLVAAAWIIIIVVITRGLIQVNQVIEAELNRQYNEQ